MAWLMAFPVCVTAVLWGAAALWFDGPPSRIASGLLAGGFVLASLACPIFLRPLRRALGVFALIFAGLLVWWLGISPRNDRDWQVDVSRLARATIEGDQLTIENVRNFGYRAVDDFDERWETRVYDLNALRGVDFVLSYWSSPHIAHTIVSWQFEGAPPLAVSIETRKEIGESYSALRGFFRAYELYYVVADERDLVKLRTHFRREEVYLYHLTTPPGMAREVLLDYLAEINALAERPKWYNAFTHNCTTTIRRHVQHVAPDNPWNWRLLVNGHLDELGYRRGQIASHLPFGELRRRSRIDEVARAAGDEVPYSEAIRSRLPAREAESLK
jgi:hypothetical protein